MRIVFAVLWQTALLLLAAFTGFLAGVAVPALRLSHVVERTASFERTYDLAWLVATLVVYALLLLLSAVRHRVQRTWPATTVSLLIAVLVIVLFTRVGYKDTPLQ